MNRIIIFKAYPLASLTALFPSTHINRFFACLEVVSRAVSELGKLNHRRMVHVLGVISSLEALGKKDFAFFLQRVPETLRQEEMQKLQLSPAAYEAQFFAKMACVRDLFDRLPQESKEILKLAAAAHDLGIPLSEIEWDHPQNGAEVVRQLIKDEKYQGPVAELVAHHGEFSNLPSASFPRDIYQLPQRLIPALLVLDFCDATARATKEEEIENRIGLAGLDYYLSLATLQSLTKLEKAENLFALRARHGFGSIIFNRQIASETLSALSQDAREFYGGKLRCRFLNLLIFAFDNPDEQAKVLMAIYQVAQSSPAVNFSELWLDPDIDLGPVLGQNKEQFQARFKAYFLQYGIAGLLEINPLRRNMLFSASNLLNDSI